MLIYYDVTLLFAQQGGRYTVISVDFSLQYVYWHVRFYASFHVSYLGIPYVICIVYVCFMLPLLALQHWVIVCKYIQVYLKRNVYTLELHSICIDK